MYTAQSSRPLRMTRIYTECVLENLQPFTSRGTNIYTTARRLEILEIAELKQEVSVSRVTFSRPAFHTQISFISPPFRSRVCLSLRLVGWIHPLDFTTRPRLGFILILKKRRRVFMPGFLSTIRLEITLTLSKALADCLRSLRTTLIRFPFS